ncbi:hypothetical protein J4E89_000970 [Alternaria sp. Ai002NY15]|nr:hypothetical protein J4E89_000970 [Alternaria sp. Ai002NY15]
MKKFLHGHPKVMSSLQKWAGTTKVTVASFYLWNVGSVEQSSQKGLAQGLLYHVLEQNPALIPAVLPHMWKEAQSGTVDLKPPTDIELKTAFKQLGAEATNGAFAFFIDGLDEFTGNHVDGIEFVKSLAASTNIKVLVSSRPIDTCVAKLSSAPKLRLQDLTKPDIEKYVNDVIRTHLSVAEHNYLSDTSIEGLVSDMQSKADGVFLWVVLACRTLLEGFEAYDSAEELRSRVDELPAELESLFRHILNGLPPRFLQQAAKLLRVCYVDRCLRPSGTLAAIPLAWAHEKDMQIDALEQFPPFSDDEIGRKFTILEGRLQSRCRGLLETHMVHDDYGGNGYSYWTVGFMHRTVFEFLNTPDIWQMDCLRIDDDRFDVTTVLAYMSCYELWLQDSFASASTTLWHISQVEQKSPTNLSRTLNRLAFALMQSKDGCRNFFLVSQHNLSVDDLSLLLALEFDLPTFVQNYDVRGFNTRHKLGINLLQHTFEKHLLYVELKYENYLPISAVSVAHLIASGCDPTESIALSEQDTTTPWEIWMETEHTNVKETGDLENAEITMMMIRAGALCAHASLPHTKDYRARLIQQSGEWQKDLSRMKTVQDQEKMKRVCNEIMLAVAESYRSDSE